MRRYFYISKGLILDAMSFRIHYIFSCVSNLVYIVLIYFLWKSIYGSESLSLHGMTFKQTFIYLAVANTMFSLFKTWLDWDMSKSIITGSIVTYFTRPIDFFQYKFFESLGHVLSNLVMISIPSIVLVALLSNNEILNGWNMLFFLFSVIFSYIISFNIDYMTGLTSFYTESIWGISIAKDVIVMLLSGAIIPIPLFPEGLRQVVEYLPFQAIYNTPILMLTNHNLTLAEFGKMISVQSFWIVFLLIANKMYFGKASRVITVNGG